MRYLIILLIIECFSSPAYSLDFEQKIGYSPKYCAFTLEDPDGPTAKYTGGQGTGLVYIANLDRHSRIYSDFTYVDFDTEASTTNIGNTVTGYLLTSAYQHLFRVSRNIDFWAGVGVSMSQLKYEERYTVTESGYLQESFSNRDENSVGGYVNLSKEFELSETFDIGLNAAYQYLLGDSVSGFTCGAVIYYKFGSK